MLQAREKSNTDLYCSVATLCPGQCQRNSTNGYIVSSEQESSE